MARLCLDYNHPTVPLPQKTDKFSSNDKFRQVHSRGTALDKSQPARYKTPPLEVSSPRVTHQIGLHKELMMPRKSRRRRKIGSKKRAQRRKQRKH
jgi:hypothetical protein